MTFTFDPDHVAKLETEAWRAYYDKRWLRLLYLLIEEHLRRCYRGLLQEIG